MGFFDFLCSGNCATNRELMKDNDALATLVDDANKQARNAKSALSDAMRACDKDKSAVVKENICLQGQIREEQEKLSQALYGAPMPADLKAKLDYYQGKYAAAEIIYNGRYYATKDGEKHYYSEDVRMFVTPNDFRFVNKVAPFRPVKLLKEADGDFFRACDLATQKIWSALPPRYTREQQAWGVSEYWNTPQESHAGAPMDCEDHTNRLLSHLRAAGVPAEMAFGVAGDTSIGGHDTVYQFLSDWKWHHLEATARCPGDILDTPTKANPDTLWINDVWFKYNDKYSFNEFATNSSADAFEEQTRLKKSLRKHFVIKGW